MAITRLQGGGFEALTRDWGDRPSDEGHAKATTKQGTVPQLNHTTDGFYSIALARFFPSNGYGLCDMTGNVWDSTQSHMMPVEPSHPASIAMLPSNSWRPLRRLKAAHFYAPTTTINAIQSRHGKIKMYCWFRRVLVLERLPASCLTARFPNLTRRLIDSTSRA